MVNLRPKRKKVETIVEKKNSLKQLLRVWLAILTNLSLLLFKLRHSSMVFFTK